MVGAALSSHDAVPLQSSWPYGGARRAKYMPLYETSKTILTEYSTAKNQPLAGHPLGSFIRYHAATAVEAALSVKVRKCMVRYAILFVAAFAGALSASIAFAAGPFGSIHIGNWNGGAFTDDKTGAFSHCAAATTYASGISVAVGQNVNGPWVLTFSHPTWQLSPGETFPIDITFDGQAQFHLFGTAGTSNIINAVLPSKAAVDQFRKSQTMVAVAKGQTFQFNLSTGQLLPTIANCVTKMRSGGIANAGDFSVLPPKPPVAVKPANSTATAAAEPSSPAKPRRLSNVNGAGFVISASGHIVTANHVVRHCVGDIHGNLTGESAMTLRVVSNDAINDLALLQAPGSFKSVGTIRGTAIHPGDAVIAIGYPFHGLLTSDFTVTTGIVSSLSGLFNDTRFLQISVPIQPGNSGGPLLGINGHVVGVVPEKINAMTFAKATGDIPENISFAIKTGAVRDFLDNSVISYQTADTGVELKTAQIVSAARAYTMLISCTADEDDSGKK
jgi:S1-C subfamily serine protease